MLSITLNTKKDKTIKEKNIKNEITKYEIAITSNVEFFFKKLKMALGMKKQ